MDKIEVLEPLRFLKTTTRNRKEATADSGIIIGCVAGAIVCIALTVFIIVGKIYLRNKKKRDKKKRVVINLPSQWDEGSSIDFELGGTTIISPALKQPVIYKSKLVNDAERLQNRSHQYRDASFSMSANSRGVRSDRSRR